MICDTEPKYKEGERIPSSDKAYIIAQVLEPKVARDQRYKYRFNNAKEENERFDAFLEDFQDI
jgi:hypothetical protein